MSSKSVQSSEVIVGKILWLPPFDEVPAGSVQPVGQTPSIIKDAFDHPVVVCSRPASCDGEYVHFHIVTSFRNRSLTQRFDIGVQRQRRQLNWYLPIVPSEYHEEDSEPRFGRPRIELENGKTMPSNSFINAKDIYSIQWRLLERFQWSGSHRLTASSIEHMHERTGRLVTYKLEAQHLQPTVEDVDEAPSPPIRAGQAPGPSVPPMKALPPLKKWTRVDVVTPFKLAGGKTAVVFVGTIASGTSEHSQALCIVPERNVEASAEPPGTCSGALKAVLRAFGRMMGNAVSWLWQSCRRRKAGSDGLV